MKTSVLLVGSFSDNPHVYTYASSFAQALEICSYHVTRCNTKNLYFKKQNRYTGHIHQYSLNNQLKKTIGALKPNILFLIKHDTIDPQTLTWAKQYYNPIVIAFYPDNPFVFWNGNSNTNILSSLPMIDYFLSWSKMLMPTLQSAGCKNVLYFPFAFDETLFSQNITITDEDKKKYAADLSFVGTWEPSREQWLTAIIQQMPSINLAVWGNHWEKNLTLNHVLRKYLRGPAIYNTDMIKAFRHSKIVLNFIRQQNMTSHNMRTFEVPASNAFLLTERTYEQSQVLFTEDKHIACFQTLDELVKKIAFYLSHDTLRKQMAEKACAHVQQFTLVRQLDAIMHNILQAQRRPSEEKHKQSKQAF